MNVLDLFSGIGGFSLGLEAAGMRTVAFCEIEKYPQKILKQHWPDIPIFDDVRKLTKEQLPEPIDLICGGYPCQPFSVAGKQLGTKDERHLWPEVLRLVQSIRPRWVVCENVAGHIKLGFDEVATSLENQGYTVWPFVIPACAVNAPHRRDRIWIIGYAKHNGLSASAQLRSNETTSNKWREEKSFSSRQSEGAVKSIHVPSIRGSKDASKQVVTNTNSIGREGVSIGEVQRERTFLFKSSGSFTQWADGWDISSPRICGIHDGIPNRTHRLKTLGNTIVPQIAYLIGLTIMEYESIRVNN